MDGSGVQRPAVADRAKVGDVKNRLGNHRQRDVLRRRARSTRENKGGSHHAKTGSKTTPAEIHFLKIRLFQALSRFQGNGGTG
jgi:thymidine kinase